MEFLPNAGLAGLSVSKERKKRKESKESKERQKQTNSSSWIFRRRKNRKSELRVGKIKRSREANADLCPKSEGKCGGGGELLCQDLEARLHIHGGGRPIHQRAPRGLSLIPHNDSSLSATSRTDNVPCLPPHPPPPPFLIHPISFLIVLCALLAPNGGCTATRIVV